MEPLKEQVMGVLRWLAGQCDGAVVPDGAGFSGTDSPIGRALAQKESWSDREYLAALRFCVKYQKQVANSCMRFDLANCRVEIERLAEVTGSRGSLRKSDVATGDIWRGPDGRIYVKLGGYFPAVLAEVRELIGRQWDAAAKTWVVNGSAENAAAAEDIAARFGLVVKIDPEWRALKSTRRVVRNGNWLHVEGVNASQILRSLPERKGKPDQDEGIFRSIRKMGPSTIGIPLRSWVISSAALWLSTLPEADPNYRRLEWAREEMIKILNDAYEGALEQERAWACKAGALDLPVSAVDELKARLPSASADRVMPHQWVGIAVLQEHPQVLLADEQGLGKTIEILIGLEIAKAFPAIILVPKIAMLNWRDEAKSWLPDRKVSVRGGDVGKADRGLDIGEADIVILNYDSFDKHRDSLIEIKPAALIMDEAQYLKGYDSNRTRSVKEFSLAAKVQRIIALTGTPIMNRPSELLTLLTLLPDMLDATGGFDYFAARYCRATYHSKGLAEWWDYGGAENVGELSERIRATGQFVRREKALVLPNLPPKTHEMQPVPISNRDEYNKAREDFSAWLKTYNRKNKEQRVKKPSASGEDEGPLREALAALGWDPDDLAFEGHSERAEALKKITYLRSLAGMGKIQPALDWISRVLVKDGKLVVFAYSLEVQRGVVDSLAAAGIQPLVIMGETAAKARRESIRQFQNDPASKIIVCSLKAAQTAMTLTAACRSLFIEFDWSPSALQQAEDRIHRIGQTRPVTITYLRAEGTLDDRMCDLIEKKTGIIKAFNSQSAPWGYRKDGAPRRQPAGPGRPRLDPEIRSAKQKAAKASWQANNLEYMREYMARRRRDQKLMAAQTSD